MPFTNTLFSVLAWGDYDNDGKLDLALAGSGPIFKIYHNGRCERRPGGAWGPEFQR